MASAACGLGSQFWLDAKKGYAIVRGAREWPARWHENAPASPLWQAKQIQLTPLDSKHGREQKNPEGKQKAA